MGLLPRIAKGCVITTNFDDAIEQTYRGVGVEFHAYMHGTQEHNFFPRLVRGDRCLLKLHGDADNPETHILTQAQYTDGYGNPFDFHKPLPKALRQAFVSQSLLFLGCSLEQDWTLELLEKATKADEYAIPNHYAILPAPEDAQAKQEKANAVADIEHPAAVVSVGPVRVRRAVLATHCRCEREAHQLQRVTGEMLTENELEALALTWFQDAGWEYRHGPDIASDGETPERADYRQVVLTERLRETLHRLNPRVPEAALDEVLHRVAKLHELSLVQSNWRFHEALVDGMPVEVEQGGDKRGDRVRLIDFEHPRRNRYLVVNQYTVQGTKQPPRPDLVCFINGLPIAVIELKNPAAEQADIWSAFNQLDAYKTEIADLFVFNEALVISDGLNARVGSLTADRERFLPWRTIHNENDRPLLEFELEKVVRGFFAPELLLDYLRYFVLFEQGDDGLTKKIAGYHQFHAVREAVRVAVIAATQPTQKANQVREERASYGKQVEPGSRKGGIVWHTQGSGKSMSMVCFAGQADAAVRDAEPDPGGCDRPQRSGRAVVPDLYGCALSAQGDTTAGRRPRAAANAAGGSPLGWDHLQHGAEVLPRRQ